MSETVRVIGDLIVKNRSSRRFYQEVPMEMETLRELVGLARLSASSANIQPLKYILPGEPEKNALIFRYLPTWAGYLRGWPGPAEGERPSAYIVLGDTEVSPAFSCDHGIAAQSIMPGAAEGGLGGFIISTVEREGLSKALNIPSRYEILLVLALGKPRESVVLETVGADGDIRYWRDGDGVHHVPKRALDDIIVG